VIRVEPEKTASEKNQRPKFFSFKSGPNWDVVDSDTPTLSQRDPSLFLDRRSNGFLTWAVMPPRALNNALQVVLKEYRLSFELLPGLSTVIRQYVSGESSREITVKKLERILWSHVTDIPRKGARGGHEYVGTPDGRLHFLIEDVMSILDSAKIKSRE
jgi:hypothetical protein